MVTNGGVRNPSFYKKIGDKYNNLEIAFSIDGMKDDTNQKYRRRVNTERALSNMSAFACSKYGWNSTYWQFLIFNHNFFEIPDALDFSEMHNIKIFLKFNQRPKFIINKKRKKIVEDLYEKYKTDKSVLMLGN